MKKIGILIMLMLMTGIANATILYPFKPSNSTVVFTINQYYNLSWTEINDTILMIGNNTYRRLDTLVNASDIDNAPWLLSTSSGNVSAYDGWIYVVNGNEIGWNESLANSTYARIGVYDANITDLWSNASNQDGRLIIVEARNTAAQDGNITNLWSNASNQDGRIITLEGNVLPNDNNITALNGETLPTRNNISLLNGGVAALSGNLSGNYTLIQANTNSILAVGGNLTRNISGVLPLTGGTLTGALKTSSYLEMGTNAVNFSAITLEGALTRYLRLRRPLYVNETATGFIQIDDQRQDLANGPFVGVTITGQNYSNNANDYLLLRYHSQTSFTYAPIQGHMSFIAGAGGVASKGILPGTDGWHTLGNANYRWGLIRGVTITSGDSFSDSPERDYANIYRTFEFNGSEIKQTLSRQGFKDWLLNQNKSYTAFAPNGTEYYTFDYADMSKYGDFMLSQGNPVVGISNGSIIYDGELLTGSTAYVKKNSIVSDVSVLKSIKAKVDGKIDHNGLSPEIMTGDKISIDKRIGLLENLVKQMAATLCADKHTEYCT